MIQQLFSSNSFTPPFFVAHQPWNGLCEYDIKGQADVNTNDLIIAIKEKSDLWQGLRVVAE